MLDKKRAHRGGDSRIDGCAGIVIQIDAPHGQNTKTLSASAVAVGGSSMMESVFMTDTFADLVSGHLNRRRAAVPPRARLRVEKAQDLLPCARA